MIIDNRFMQRVNEISRIEDKKKKEKEQQTKAKGRNKVENFDKILREKMKED